MSGNHEIERPSSIEEHIPENVIKTSVDGLGYSLQIDPAGALRDGDELTIYFSRDESEFSVDSFFRWANERRISPGFVHMGFYKMAEYGYVEASVKMYDFWAEYSIQYLGNDEGRHYIEELLGCDIDVASEASKVAVFVPKKVKTLDDFLQDGVQEVMFSCQSAVSSGACRRHDGMYASTQDAVIFETEVCPQCAHKWCDYYRNDTFHLYTLDELRAAFKPSYSERYWALNGKIPLIKAGEISEDEAFKMIDIALFDFGQYDDGKGRALAHRLAGEIYFELRMEMDAAEHFRLALQFDPHVGVKRKLVAIERRRAEDAGL